MLLLYRRRWGLFYLPVLALAALAIVLAAQHLFPPAPRQVTLAAGLPDGGYARLAERYRDELARRGIAVEIVTSDAGAQGPLQRLASPSDKASVGFAHGLLAGPGAPAGVQALATIGKQPVWIFTRLASITSLSQARGLRVAAGTAGSATRSVAARILAQAQVAEGDVMWVDLPAQRAAAQLLDGAVDIVFVIGSADAPSVRQLTRAPGISMLGAERASGLARRDPRLQALVLPQGAIELRGDIPPRDLSLLYAQTHLLVRDGVHPALQRALLDAAADLHAIPDFLQRQSEYPEFHTDFPLSPVAQRYRLGDRPWLERVLPYGWAQWAALLLYAALPVAVVTVLALLWIPRMFSLRVDAVLAHYYGELKFLEREMEALVTDDPKRLRDVLASLDRIERQVVALDLPDRFADRWYTLREHLWAAQERLLQLRSR